MRTSRQSLALTWRRAVVAAVATALVLVVTPAQVAHAAPGLSVDLKVLLVSDGGEQTAAFAELMDREGVPYTTVNAAPGHPAITDAFLADAATRRGHFQAIILPNQAGTGLSAAEMTALANYERTYGVRQVNAYTFPGASTGQGTPTTVDPLDGAAATVTSAGLEGPFAYLTGSLTIDDIDPAVNEVYAYLAGPAASLPAGETFTPLVNATKGGVSGAIVGVYAHDFREELSITAAYNINQQWFNEVGHGILTWATRGMHLGYHRNYLAVHVDDIFLADSRWSSINNCTPGDTPTCHYSGFEALTGDIRMTAADVTRLVNWQHANGFKFDMLFNGQGSDERTEPEDPEDPESPPRVDLLTNAFLAAKNEFTWVNHTYSHPFLGCLQIAPTVSTSDWHCATTSENTGYYDDTLVPFAQESGGIKWLGTAKLLEEVQKNQAWATDHELPNFDPSALVTGEHSGLLTTPQQPIDNPFLGPVLDTAGIAYTGSDASREEGSRFVSNSSARTLPRHPMNIFYNAGKYADEVDEYNWIYTAAPGGSGICTSSGNSTCITALPNANATQAQSSFLNYIVPIEVRNAYRYVITGDPRPFYAHQSNIAEDGILYPVVKGILDRYTGTHKTTVSPLVTEDLVSLGEIMDRSSDWTAAMAGVSAYVDADGVHVSGPDGTSVPLTVPTGTTVNVGSFEAYDGELSGWFSASSSGALVAVPPTALGGYIGHTVPDAPAAVLGTPGPEFYGSIALTWTAPLETGNSPITDYVIERSLATGTPSWGNPLFFTTESSYLVTGLTENTQYIFRIRAVNAVGTSEWSVNSAPILAKPAQYEATDASVAAPDVVFGNAATVTLTVPTTNGHAPTGTATLTIDGGPYTAGIVGNTATFSVPGLAVGAHPYSVAYGADLYILPLTRTGSLAVTKAAAAATGAVVVHSSPVKTGSYQVTVTPPTGLPEATGGVTVTLSKDGVDKVLTGTLSGGAATLDLPVLPAGTWTAAVAYAGDANYNTATAVGASVESVKAAVTVSGVVGTASTPQSTGTYSVTVAQETGLPDATGNVTVTLTNGAAEPVVVGGTLSTGAVTIDLPVLPAGTWEASVAYVGDDNYAATTVGGASVVSTKAAVTVAGAVNVASTPQKPGTYDVTVTQPDGLAAATGSVTVTLTNGSDTTTATAALSAGAVTIDLPTLHAGTWTASVAYAGDANYNAATVDTNSVDSTKDTASVAGAVGTAPSPQETGTYDIAVTAPSGLALATGSVTVTLAHGSDSHELTGTLTGGAVTVTVPKLPVGTWAASVAYGGDENYAATTVAGAEVVSTTGPVTVTGAVVASPSPQHTGSYSVTLTPEASLAAPTGTVTVTLTKGTDTETITGTLTDGAATLEVPALAAGTWAAAIAYSGDSNYAAPTATGASVLSQPDDVSAVPGSVTKQPTSTTAGSYKVTVTPPSGYTAPSGNVTVVLKRGTSTRTLSGSLSGGTVTLPVARIAAGTWTAEIRYLGDANYAAKTAVGPSVVSVKGAVSKISTSVTKRPTPTKAGTYKITVSPPSTLPHPTGKVTLTLTKGSVTKKIAGTLKSGVVSVTVPKLPNGVWKASVAYAGDATYASKTSAGAYVVVGHTKVSKILTTVTKAPTTKATGSYKVTVTHSTGLPTVTGKVTVTLKKGSTTKKVYGTLSSGAVTVKLPKLPKGTWKVSVAYAGSSVYVKAGATGASVVVTK